MRFSFTAWIMASTIATFASASPVIFEYRLAARANHSCGPVYCLGTNNTHDNPYFCGDSRLGPKVLPKKLPLAAEIYGYDRLGGLCPGAFLQRWYNTTARSYIYPPQNGFQLNTASQPIEGNQTLTVGMRLDRFGSEFGFFLSPIGAPYNQRAIPPSNLDTPPTEPNFPYNYHVYEVVKSFDTLSGPVAGWFGQPGQGIQYQTYSNVITLINDGFLQRVDRAKGT